MTQYTEANDSNNIKYFQAISFFILPNSGFRLFWGKKIPGFLHFFSNLPGIKWLPSCFEAKSQTNQVSSEQNIDFSNYPSSLKTFLFILF